MVRNYQRKTEDAWSKEDLLEALMSIKNGKLKINDAAKKYNISRATLYRQYQKFVLGGCKPDVNQFRTSGGNPILTAVEEDVLEKTILDLRGKGYTVTSSDIKKICFEYCLSNDVYNQFNMEKRMASDDWYYGFLKRRPAVRESKAAIRRNTNESDLVREAAAAAPSEFVIQGDVATVPAGYYVLHPPNLAIENGDLTEGNRMDMAAAAPVSVSTADEVAIKEEDTEEDEEMEDDVEEDEMETDANDESGSEEESVKDDSSVLTEVVAGSTGGALARKIVQEKSPERIDGKEDDEEEESETELEEDDEDEMEEEEGDVDKDDKELSSSTTDEEL